jgi:uncharacterized phage-associated protein
MSTELRFHFNFDRTLQAAAYLLKLANRQGQEMTYIHLLKLLYIADRQYLAERGYPLTGDKPVAMQYGPILSRTYDLIKNKTEQADKWQRYIQTLPQRSVLRLMDDPGDGDLSQASISKLEDIFQQYGHLRPCKVIDLTHEFLEWQEYYHDDTSTPIPLEAILRAQGASDMLQQVEEQAQLHAHTEALRRACG